MPTADVGEMVAAMILDPRHRCSPNCLCDQLKEVPEIAEWIQRLESLRRWIVPGRHGLGDFEIKPTNP